jgi:hypothetical protein
MEIGFVLAFGDLVSLSAADRTQYKTNEVRL